MKKLLLVIVMFLLVGCGSKEGNKVLDLNGVKSELTNVKIEDVSSFASLDNINALDVLESYGIDVNLLDDYLIYISTEVEDPSMYIIALPKDGEEAVVKYQIDEFFTVYHAAYNGYYPEVAYMIENRKEDSIGDYLVYVVSRDNNKVYDLIKKNYK